MSYEVIVTSSNIQVMRLNPRVWVQIYESRVPIHDLRVQIYELRVQIHYLRVQIRKLRV